MPRKRRYYNPWGQGGYEFDKWLYNLAPAEGQNAYEAQEAYNGYARNEAGAQGGAQNYGEAGLQNSFQNMLSPAWEAERDNAQAAINERAWQQQRQEENPYIPNGTHSFEATIKGKKIKLQFDDKTPHKFKLSEGSNSETFEFKCYNRKAIVDQYNKNNPSSPITINDINKFSLNLFYDRQTKVLFSSVDSVEIRNWRFVSMSVLDLLVDFTKQNDRFYIEVIGNAAIPYDSTKDQYQFIGYTPLNDFSGFTRTRAQQVVSTYFKNSTNGIYALSVNDVNRNAYDTLSKPNEDATGIQFFLKTTDSDKPKFID